VAIFKKTSQEEEDLIKIFATCLLGATWCSTASFQKVLSWSV